MRKMLSILQASLLFAAVALAGTAFMPVESQAYGEACGSSCDGGRFPCGGYIDPVTGQFVKCTLSCV